MISLIVAFSKNYVIGNNGKIPWEIEGEKKRFKDLTTGNVVIMGRRTYEEIGRPLPNRTTIVLSHTRNFDAENCMTAKSLPEALRLADGREVFIAGGAKIYEEALPLVEKMYITEIDATIPGDTYFPDFDKGRFTKEINLRCGGNIPYTYVTYTKKQI